MATLLFSAQSPSYAAHYLLSEDKLYFKQRRRIRASNCCSGGRTQTPVGSGQLGSGQQEFLTRVSQAILKVEWERYDRQRLEALERYATQKQTAASSGAESRISRTRLSAPNSRTGNDDRGRLTPQAAFQLLVDLSIWSVHENLFLRRSQIRFSFLIRYKWRNSAWIPP